MEQAEGCGEERRARRATVRACRRRRSLGAHELEREGGNAECDQRFDGALRYVEPTERCRSERDAVSQREGRNGKQQLSPIAQPEHQSEHEEQMIGSREDVRPAKGQVPLEDCTRGRTGGDAKGRFVWIE